MLNQSMFSFEITGLWFAMDSIESFDPETSIKAAFDLLKDLRGLMKF
jgi:hypothetical protein